MKKHYQFWALCATLLFFAACSKNDAAPDVPAGNYEMTYFKAGGVELTLPQQGRSGTIVLTQVDADNLRGTMTATNNGQTQTADLGLIRMAKESAGYGLFDGQQRIGSYSNRKVEIAGDDQTGQPVVVRGTKK
jgi:hypothetical protein